MIKKVVTSTESNWTKQEGLYHHIVISSRIRLARNLAKLPMPAFQDESSAFTVLEKVKKLPRPLIVKERSSCISIS